MLNFLTPLLLIAQGAFAAPVGDTATTAAATTGKIRGVRDPIYHLYLQANPKNSAYHLLFLLPYPKFSYKDNNLTYPQHPHPFSDPKPQPTNL